MKTTGWALIAAAMTVTPAQGQTATAISLDRLVQEVIANNPERLFYQQQIDAAGTEREAAGRWADPEAVVEFGERRASDRATGAPIGDGRRPTTSAVTCWSRHR